MSRTPLPRTYFINQQNFNNADDGQRALNNQTKIINRLWNKYNHSFSALLVLSNVDGKIAERYNAKAGQVGAPKWEYRLKPKARGILFKNFHLHIVFVGYYAATASEEFRDIMNSSFWKKHPDERMKGNPFTSELATGDGLYSKSYYMNQYKSVRYVGDKKRLDVYDRNNPSAVELYPEFREELDLLRNQKKAPNPLEKVQQRNTHYINKGTSNDFYDNNSAGTAEAGTALGNFNIDTYPAATPFVSKTIKKGKYSYTYTPKADSNFITPAKGRFDSTDFEIGYSEKSSGFVHYAKSEKVNNEIHQNKSSDDKFITLRRKIVGADGLLIDPRNLFDPLDSDDTTDWAELFRIYDKSPNWMKKLRTPMYRIF